jgi:tetracycline 7-halogenase / FADH2 O2-dependent halogenase
MRGAFDLAILGSGFGGTLLAMVARRLGLSVLLLERGTHPRFAIGESTSPLCNLLLEELSRRYELPRLLPLCAYGTWKRKYPELTVGLKRGFTFYGHRAGEPFAGDDRERQLLVAASPADEVADTHWYRAEFDHFLLREAMELGAEYVDRVTVQRVTFRPGGTELEVTREGRRLTCRARFLVDATGPRGALSRLLDLPERPFEGLPRTEALYSHFTGVARFAPQAGGGGEPTPYPPDDAALHHVFEGGWMWVLRFENGVTSAGFAAEEGLARELALADREGAWRRFLRRFPPVGLQFQGAEPVRPLVHHRPLPYRCGQIVGEGWALLPSAGAFVDPLFSTGFPLTLLGIHRLGEALGLGLDTPEFHRALADHAAATTEEAGAAALLVGGCYRSFHDFPAFAALSMLYFAAASYAEMARRLGRGHLARRFLLQDRPDFRDLFQTTLAAAREGASWDREALAGGLEPFNVAGLCDPAKRNRYGVDLEDAVRAAARLECSEEEVRAWIQASGLA